MNCRGCGKPIGRIRERDAVTRLAHQVVSLYESRYCTECADELFRPHWVRPAKEETKQCLS